MAIGISEDGERRLLGSTSARHRALWTAFLRRLMAIRGLRGVRLVVSDAHEGLKQPLTIALSGTTWHRCRVHFMRNLLRQYRTVRGRRSRRYTDDLRPAR